MGKDEFLTQAEKYRTVAFNFPPHVDGPQGRQYYLDMANELERQARAMDTPPPPPPPPTPEPAKPEQTTKPEDTPLFELASQVKIHQGLAMAVLADKRAGMHRAFAVWVTLRQSGRVWHHVGEVTKFYSELTGKHPRNIRRWLDAGDGLFWNFGSRGHRRTLSMFGKNRVFAIYGLGRVGRVFNVDTCKLLGKLQGVRAALFALWVDKDSRWAARPTIQGITSVPPRTQQLYDNANGQHRQTSHAIDWQIEGGQVRQLPNRYHARFYPAFQGKQNQKRYDLYTVENNGLTCDQLNVGHSSTCCFDNRTVKSSKPIRILFDNPRAAAKAAKERGKMGLTGQCFAVLDTSKHGKLLLKTFAYGIA